jgi:predicted nucleic acid-binding protein
MTPYADTNFFTNVLLELPFSRESEQLMERLHESSAALPVSLLLRLEVISALQRLLFQSRTGTQSLRITAEMALLAEAAFLSQLEDGFLLRDCTLAEPALTAQFSDLVHHHTARHGFRTYDVLHVATALVLGCDTFWTFDSRTKKLARLEGLRTN